MASAGRSGVAVGGVSLVVACFLASAALRVVESAPAFAQSIGQFGETVMPVSAEAPWRPAAGETSDSLLLAIRDREAQLDAKERSLADRAQALVVAEKKLQEQLTAFETARRNLEGTLAQADKAAERDIDRMTTVYENMKPADAAVIFEQMDVNFAAGLLARMRPEVTASVLAGMQPEAAYAVTLTIASRNSAVPTE
jgi:flagellar motility protein MotE (MotC chaperone)